MSQISINEAEKHIQQEATQPSVAPHQCQCCENILLDMQQKHRSSDRQQAPGWRIDRHDAGFTLADALSGSKNGCAFFENLISRATIDTRDHHTGAILDNCERNTCPHNVTFTFETDDGQPYIHFKYSSTVVLGWFEVYARPKDFTVVDFVPTQLPPNLIPGSELSIKRIEQWRRGCDEQHTKCHAYRRNFTPKRLIDVDSSSTRVKLVGSDHYSHDEYAALSYCWGGDQLLKTTKARLPEYEEGIDIQALPQTVRDSILVVRGLRIRYLWIDAYCIVQDDPVDKTEQIGQMHKIFRGSAVTLAATSTQAKASTDGFLALRERYRPFIINVRLDVARTASILLTPWNMGNEVEEPSFHKRGWTLQETHLACRILAFEDQGIRWCCLEAENQDGGYITPVLDRGLNPGAQSIDVKAHPASWLDIVVRFARRELSVPSDKLPAISALAEEYALRHDAGRFLAGMWESRFVPQLTWSVWNGSRPQCYRAPSWSWASLDGKIVYRTHAKERFWQDLTVTCAVNKVETSAKSSSAPFGEVTDGSLTLRGNVKRLIWIKRDASAPHGANGWRTDVKAAEVHNGIDPHFDLNMDIESEWNDGEFVLTCVELYRVRIVPGYGQHARGHNVYCLVLAETGLPFKYKRVGVVISAIDERGLQWFDYDAEVLQLTII